MEKSKRRRRIQIMEEIESNRKEENGKVTEIRGVLFVPHTNMSELSKRIRKKLNDMENIS